MKNIFTEHPQSIGETYWQHFVFAFRFGGMMTLGGIACLLHAIFPFLFQKTGSNILIKMSHDVISRMKQTEPEVVALGSLIQNKIKSGNQDI